MDSKKKANKSSTSSLCTKSKQSSITSSLFKSSSIKSKLTSNTKSSSSQSKSPSKQSSSIKKNSFFNLKGLFKELRASQKLTSDSSPSLINLNNIETSLRGSHKKSKSSCVNSYCSSFDKHYGKMITKLKPSYSVNDIDYFIKKSTNGEHQFGLRDERLVTKNEKPFNFKSNIDLLEGQRQAFYEASYKWCPLCLSKVDIKEMHFMWSCGCCFCLQCLKSYLTINITDNHQIGFLSCPNSNCSNDNLITSQEIELLVDNATFKLYQKFKLDLEIEQDPSRTWCPISDCVNICLIKKPNLTSFSSLSLFDASSTSTRIFHEDNRKYFYCDKCDIKFCAQCRKVWHPEPGCESYKEYKNFPLFSQSSALSSKSGNIKRCPRCSVWIERDEGCAQMTCRKCKHVFCWFCLQSLEVRELKKNASNFFVTL